MMKQVTYTLMFPTYPNCIYHNVIFVLPDSYEGQTVRALLNLYDHRLSTPVHSLVMLTSDIWRCNLVHRYT